MKALTPKSICHGPFQIFATQTPSHSILIVYSCPSESSVFQMHMHSFNTIIHILPKETKVSKMYQNRTKAN